jgi:hypothetical protein
MAKAEKLNLASTTIDDSATAAKKPRRLKAEKIYLGDAATGEIYAKESAIDSRWRELLKYHLPIENTEKGRVVFVDSANPLGDKPLVPGPKSPLCAQCKMDALGAGCPYMGAYGSETPLITIITEIVTQNQDDAGELVSPNSRGIKGGANTIYQFLARHMNETGIDPDTDIRWLSITRCAVRGYKKPALATKANWCRYHVVQDLKLHPPKVIMPFGTAALGALSHKSNAYDWQGKILTYRGWPDDWLMEPKYMLPRKSPLKDGSSAVGHPIFGASPVKSRTLLYPLQSPSLIWAQRNELVTAKWKEAILQGLALAKNGCEPLNYNLPHYRIATNPDEVKIAMQWLIDHPETLVAFDTETNGLKQFTKKSRIVFMMFRWVDPETNSPMSIGFPWNYPESPLYSYVEELTPWVLEGLGASYLCGHNLAFDLLWVAATLGAFDGETDEQRRNRTTAIINILAPRGIYDTWHMAYTAKQQRGSLGLERLAYDHVPNLAGYEEDMTLLIKLHGDMMDPASKKGGHYAMCPLDKWDTHLKSYVMGDVEVTYCARESLSEKLASRPLYDIPLANPDRPGSFRRFNPPSREWVYSNIMSPANAMLTKMMARGMFIDVKTLRHFENQMPNEIVELKGSLKTKFPAIGQWIDHRENQPLKEGSDKPWEFDLENKAVLKELLFEFMRLPIQRLTKVGKSKYPSDDIIAATPHEELLPYAAVDKFTLNKLAADHEIARPLLDYRKKYKLYTTYVRPQLNCFDERVDRKRRDKEPHLWLPEDGGDCLLHSSFMLTGTRGGRLCVAGETVLSVKIGSSTNLPIGVEIKNLWKLSGKPLYVKTDKNRWKKIKTIYFKGYEEMFQVCAGRGAEIKATKNHRIKTDRGWEPIGQVKVGSRVQVDLPQRNWPGADGGKLRRLSNHEGVELCEDVRKHYQESYGSESETLQREISETTGVAVLTKIGRASNRKQKRLSATIRNFSEAEVFSSCQERVRHMATSKGAKLVGVFSKAELTILQHKIEQEDCTVWSSDTANTTDGRLGQDLSWTEQNARRIFARATGIPVEGISDIYQMSDGCLVFEGYLPKPLQIRHRKVKVATGRDFMVRPPSRSRASDGTTKLRDTVLSGIHNTELRQPPSRLCSNRNKSSDRDRRRLPQERKRRKAGFRISYDGLSSDSIYSCSSQAQDGLGIGVYSEPHFRAITSIVPCGSQEVWDIEVEDDASYVAQGLVHHNSSKEPNLQQLPSDSGIKKMFTSRFGSRGCIYAGDLSQIELRLLAAACGDPNMLKAYRDNLDLHTLTTSRIFKLPYETFSKAHMAKLQDQGKADEAKKLDLKRRIGKCVDPSTLVSVDSRIMRISDLHPGREDDTFYPMSGRFVQTPGGKSEIRSFYSNGVQKRVLVVARHGLIACSLSHRFQLKDGSLVMAQDLKKGMELADVVDLKCSSDVREVGVELIGSGISGDCFTAKVTDNLTYVLGLFYGDGTCNDNRIGITTGGANDFAEWQDSIADSLRKVGFLPSIGRTLWDGTKPCSKLGNVTGAYGEVVFGSRRVLDIFEQLGAVKRNKSSVKRTLVIPTWLFNSSESAKLSFLAGLCDTDGYVKEDGISICTKSWRFAQDVNVLARSIGILSTFDLQWNKVYKKYYYVVRFLKRCSDGIVAKLRNHHKQKIFTPAKFHYQNETSNKVKMILKLEDGLLLDISLDDPHLYVPEGLTTHQTCNFLTGYGGGAFGLQTTLANSKIYMSVEECEDILASFFESYPTLREYLGVYKGFIEENGVAVSITGRVRIFDEVYSEDREQATKALRAGCNHLIQATASDIMLVCLCFIEDWMRRENLESMLVLTVHDSLVIDAVVSELPKIHEIVDQTLNHIPEVLQYVFGADYDTSWMIVPLAGDMSVGINYKDQINITCNNPDWDELIAKSEA